MQHSPSSSPGGLLNDPSFPLLSSFIYIQCYVEAISGIGLYCSYPEKDPAHPFDCSAQDRSMPRAYENTLSGNYTQGNPWDVQASHAPDAVIINLGTNDLCCNREQNATHYSYFIASYIDFVEKIAGRYNQLNDGQHSTFFLASGPMRYNYAQAVKEVIQQIQQRGIIDNQVSFLDLYTDTEMTGCLGHPNYQQHQEAYVKARQQIADVTGWTYL